MRILVLCSFFALMGCAQIEQAVEVKREVVTGVMDRACEQPLDIRQAEYRAFGDTRLLPFDCDGDGLPDFVLDF